jgi:iron complex outermembrane receptor protein
MKKQFIKVVILLLLLPLVFWLRILLVELFLTRLQDSQFQECKCTGNINGVSTDFDGSNCQCEKRIISFFLTLVTNSIVNYNGQKSITVSLEKMQINLNEVVIQVGYGTVKKKT